MKITSTGVYFDSYVGASIAPTVCAFDDRDGATLLIDAATLVRMYELVRFDLERRGGWADLMSRIESDPV